MTFSLEPTRDIIHMTLTPQVIGLMDSPYKECPLHNAVERSAFGEVEALLGDEDEYDVYIDVNELNDEGYTPLMIAAMNNRPTGLMRILIDANADLDTIGGSDEDIEDDRGASALMLAASRGSIAAMQVLVNARADVDLECKSRLATALFHAAKTGSCDKVQLLLGANASLDKMNKNLETAVDIAEINGHENIVRLLLDAKAAPRDDWHRMRDACIEGRADDVKALIDAGYRLDLPVFGSNSLMLLAITHGNTAVARTLLDARAEINAADKQKLTPLMHSINLGDIDFSRALIAAQADVVCASSRKTPLTCAAASGDLNAIRMLLNAKAIVDAGRPTPLMLAAKGGYEKAVRVLLDANAAPDDRSSSPPLHHAIEGGDPRIVKMLLAAKAQLRAPDNERVSRADALTIAARHGKPAIMKILIDAKAPLERVDPQTTFLEWIIGPSTPLATAIRNGHFDAVKLLLDAKARIDVPGTEYIHHLIRYAIESSAKSDNNEVFELVLEAANAISPAEHWGLSALRRAVDADHSYVVKRLLDLNISPNTVYENEDASTLLMKAAAKNSVDVGKALIDAKANIDFRLKWHRTALMTAARDRRPEFVKMLLGNKASIDLMDESRRTALDHAINRDHDDPSGVAVVKILVEAKASLELANAREETPLHAAALLGHADIAKVLVEAKANVNSRSRVGVIPLMRAVQSGAAGTVRTLLNANLTSFDAQDKNGMTAPMFAVCGGRGKDYPEILKMLLEDAVSRCAAESRDEPPAKRFKRRK